MKYKAFLFDLNGTMIDDMDYHINAWYRLLNELGANISLERTRHECYGRGEELLERVFPGKFTPEEMKQMIIAKETKYQQDFRPHLQLLKGLGSFLQKGKRAGIKMAIGSAAIRFNIDFVIDGLDIRHYFSSIISADDVKHSKPDPETFLRCAQQLGIDPSQCLVFEDAPKGVEAAERAGMDTVVLTTLHDPYEFTKYRRVIAFAKDYQDTSLLSAVELDLPAIA